MEDARALARQRVLGAQDGAGALTEDRVAAAGESKAERGTLPADRMLFEPRVLAKRERIDACRSAEAQEGETREPRQTEQRSAELPILAEGPPVQI